MRYVLTENPYLWVRFNTGDSPTITIYDASDDSVIINAAAMSELGATGFFKYQFNPTATALTEYFYIAETTTEEQGGKIILGGYPNTIIEDTNDLQLNQGNWLTATGFSTPNEYDVRLTNISNNIAAISTSTDNLHDEAFGEWTLDPVANTLTLYKADGTTVLKVFDLTATEETVPSYIRRVPR